jgi:hypothetical protein
MDAPFSGMPVEVGPDRWLMLAGDPILVPGLGRIWGTTSGYPVLARLDVQGRTVWSLISLRDVNYLYERYSLPWRYYATVNDL